MQDHNVRKSKRKKITIQAVKPLPTIRKRSHFGTEYHKAPPPRKGKEKSRGIKRVQAWPETGS
jgi:hypothetical protein